MRDSVSRVIDPNCCDLPCPHCGPNCRSVANQKRLVMRVWRLPDGAERFYCARCGARGRRGIASAGAASPGRPRKQPDVIEHRTHLARTLWSAALPIGGTPAELYLRGARSYRGGLPPTLRYLAAKGKHPHAMIAAFGFVSEAVCGELAIPVAPPAVHLTRLAPDASQRLAKIMLGAVSGHPIVLAPTNDGLGLAIAEGIEDALSLHEATGLGAWAAGSAAHMARLEDAVPAYVSCVTIAEDDDPAGRLATARLGDALSSRGFEVRRLSLASAG